MTVFASLWFRRVIAFTVDWLVVALWGGMIFGVVMLFSRGNPIRPGNPWSAQALGFLAMTLPVWLYFSVLESSRLMASLGKRVIGLRVVASGGGRVDFGAALLRNGLKFIPWELGHLVAQQATYSASGGMSLWIYLPMVLSLLGPAWWIISMIRSGHTPYDRLSGASVVHRA
jgi:uncharacterized RDD family membrane protein YckC